MLDWRDDCFDDEYYGLRANVFVNVKIYDLDNAPDSTRIFPLPSGKDTTSLRQHSHIFIESEDAKLLTKKILQAVKKELN